MAAEGFGRWEADPLFPAAECVQDSADRMEGVYRLLLHERKLIHDDTSNTKLHIPIQYERDVSTALGTTKWQLEQFEREVNAASLSNKSNSRENAILQFRQFIRAISVHISQVEDSLEGLRTDSSRYPKQSYSIDHDGDGLASFLSGSNSKDNHLFHSTDTDEIVELQLGSIPTLNGYHSAQEHTSCELRYSGNDVEGAANLQCSCGESGCEGDHNNSSMHNLDSDDSVDRKHHFKGKLSRQYHSFMRSLWFKNRGRESFTKRRKDGEVVGNLRNESTLPSFNLPSSGRPMYFWPELIKRRLSRSECSKYYNHPQVRSATVLLIVLTVLGEFRCEIIYL
ncbi:hypothetical protein GUJ93_ZPchr0010g10037 [Zizania palustris]|uniref:Syntaxin 6/10/61 N-terminal domain-containing protein n=1 Tax=Zizania palustris TaxID=103762 RepID=A0A8J5W9V2_ZIZPA|nr:hypothetical protein GUJ93_ZPchr0010g10037 [Zizania palustris]